jgi:transcriptional regulator with PAS, ATPase and Fis domain
LEGIYKKNKMARNKKSLLTESVNKVPVIEQDGTKYIALTNNTTMEDYQALIIQNSLNMNSGHVVNAASQLGVSKSKVYSMLKENQDHGTRNQTPNEG